MKLTKSKTKPSSLCMLCQFVKMDISNFGHRLIRFVKKNELPYLKRYDYQVPDSEVCTKAFALVSRVSPLFLLNHCLRSYAFGLSLAHKTERKIDKEVFFLGAIMHDLGLTKEFKSNDTFEISGAIAARNFCVEQSVDNERADLVHEMVALHNSVGVAHKCDPEIALLHYGAGADVAGLWVNEINRKTLDEILDQYPVNGFKDGMVSLLRQQIAEKPDSYMATMIKLGFLKKIQHYHDHMPVF